MTRHFLLLSATCLALAGPAGAEPATKAGADRITQAFQTYFGPGADVAEVTPQGDTYALKVDATPLFALFASEGITGTSTPLTMTLTDNGDGTWGVSMDQPAAFTASVPEVMDMKEEIAQLAFAGTFDEKLLSFTTFSGTAKGIRTEQAVMAPNGPATRTVITMEQGSFSSTAAANPAGGVDSELTASILGLSETFEMPLDPGAPAIPVTLTAESMSQSGTITGMRMENLAALLAWAVAHPGPEIMYSARAEAKPLVTAALPVFEAMDAKASISVISVQTPLGTFGLEDFSAVFALNGLVPDGLAREGFTMAGLTLPPDLVPGWAAAVLPDKASFDIQVTGYDAAALVLKALTVLDLPESQDPAPEFEDALLTALLPKGTVTIGLNPSVIEGPGYKLTYEGTMDAGPQTEIPTGKAKITLTGIDALLEVLNAAPDEMKMQAMIGIGAMRGLARQGEDGALVWEIDGMTPGKVLVNGMDLSALGGGP
jgi:hypothetical protein